MINLVFLSLVMMFPLPVLAKELSTTACDVWLRKGQDPKVNCIKNKVNKKSQAEVMKRLHEMRLPEMSQETWVAKCFRERAKDRLVARIFTVCHDEKKQVFRVFVTAFPLDPRTNIYISGMKLPWYEQDTGIFIYRRYLTPQKTYKNWLLE